MKKLSIKDLAIIAIVAAVIGVVFTGMDAAYSPLLAILGPTAISLTSGIYILSAFLPAFLIRKPGAAFIGALIAAGINILTGSPYGIHILVAGALQGIGTEIGLMIFKYRRFNIFSFSLAALIAIVLTTLRDYFVFGLSQLPIVTLLGTFAVSFVSAAVIGFLIALALGKALEATGVIILKEEGAA